MSVTAEQFNLIYHAGKEEGRKEMEAEKNARISKVARANVALKAVANSVSAELEEVKAQLAKEQRLNTELRRDKVRLIGEREEARKERDDITESLDSTKRHANNQRIDLQQSIAREVVLTKRVNTESAEVDKLAKENKWLRYLTGGLYFLMLVSTLFFSSGATSYKEELNDLKAKTEVTQEQTVSKEPVNMSTESFDVLKNKEN